MFIELHYYGRRFIEILLDQDDVFLLDYIKAYYSGTLLQALII